VCDISGCRVVFYKDSKLAKYTALFMCKYLLTFRRKSLPPSSGSKKSMNSSITCSVRIYTFKEQGLFYVTPALISKVLHKEQSIYIYIYLFRVILKVITDYFRKALEKINFCKGDEICFCKLEIQRLHIMQYIFVLWSENVDFGFLHLRKT